MKNIFLTFVISCVHLFSCGQNPGTTFEKVLLQYFEKGYLIDKKSHLSNVSSEELRHPVFFSKDLLYVNEYILKSKKDVYSGTNYFHFILYSFKNSALPDIVMNKIDSLNERSIVEKNYGPLSKDYNLFFAADTYVVQFVGFCNVPQKDWETTKSKVISIGENNFKSVRKILDKQCGL